MRIAFICFAFLFVNQATAQIISDFTLVNAVDQTEVSLSNYKRAKGIVVIFTSNSCPYSKLYEERILGLHESYSARGLKILLVNSNNPDISPDDDESKMKAKAQDYPFPYLADKEQRVSEMLGARKTPEAFLLRPNGSQYHLIYQGSIDDNPQNGSDVSDSYLIDAIERLLQNKPITRDSSRPVGCMIKA